MSPVEREVKLVLESESDYERLCQSLPGFLEEVNQLNIYWDMPDETLTRAGILLRLRLEGERALLTTKRGLRKSADGLFEAPEDEAVIDRIEAEAIRQGRERLETLQCPVLIRLQSELGPLEGLQSWGSMENRRRRYQLPEGFVAEVDRTCFMAQHLEFEVEVESSEPARARSTIVFYLTRQSILFRPQTRTKSERLRWYLRSQSAGEG